MNRSKRIWIGLSLAVAVSSATAAALFAAEGPAAPGAAPAATAKPPAAAAAPAVQKSGALPAATAFDRMKGLVGEWIDVDGAYGLKNQVAVSYRLTGSGTTLVETLFIGAPHEMMTLYSRDGNDLVLTHYCSGGNQPRMRATSVSGDVVRFDFDGGTNLDPAKDQHMHSAWIEFISADEIRGEWLGWDGGKPAAGHQVKYHLKRKTS